MKIARNEFRLVLKTVLFVLCAGLAGVLFGAYPAVAHESPEGTTPSAEHADDMPRAQDVDRMDEASVRKFMEHLKIHSDGTGEGEALLFIPTDWNSLENDFYMITIASLANTIIGHEKYPQAQSASLPDLDGISDKARESEDSIVCEQDEGGNYFCAFYPFGRTDQIVVSGFDHDVDDLDFSGFTCPYVTPGSGADKDKVAADEITNEDTPENREKLKGYVIGMEKHLIAQLLEAAARARDRDSAIQEASRALAQLRPCWRIWPWKWGSIYIFIIREHGDSQYVVFNGNNPEFEGPNLFVKDEDGVDIGKLIADEVRDPDGDGFIEYKWDDPQNPDDGVHVGPRGEGFRDAPGTSPKVSYVKKISEAPGFEDFIIGSGFYPQSGDGGGCAVSGESSTPSGAAFNLFLAMSVLLSGVWLFSGGKVRERLRR